MLVLAGMLVGCDGNDASQASSGGPADKLPAGLFLSAAPEGVRDVNAVKSAAKDGDRVIVRGIIGGRKDPIAANRAILTMIDTSLATCDKTPGDTCPTPWDVCCESQETITAGSVTVQIVGPDGRPLRVGLDSAPGVAPLREIIVVGEARRHGDGANLLINASGIYLKS